MQEGLADHEDMGITSRLNAVYEREPSGLDPVLQTAQARAILSEELDIAGFREWALGNLVDNRNRGLFAEWLVGRALGVLDDAQPRSEWDAFDLLYGDLPIEVKASGRSQTWNQNAPSTPRFDIAPRRQSWIAATDEWIVHDPPTRLADVYVFCLHEAFPARNENVVDPTNWSFRVVATRTLDREVGPQKTIAPSTLDRLTPTVTWRSLRAAVDQVADEILALP